MQPHPREACWVSACRRSVAKGKAKEDYEKCLTGWGAVGGENRRRRTGEWRIGVVVLRFAIRFRRGLESNLAFIKMNKLRQETWGGGSIIPKRHVGRAVAQRISSVDYGTLGLVNQTDVRDAVWTTAILPQHIEGNFDVSVSIDPTALIYLTRRHSKPLFNLCRRFSPQLRNQRCQRLIDRPLLLFLQLIDSSLFLSLRRFGRTISHHAITIPQTQRKETNTPKCR